MKNRKETSTNNINELYLKNHCGISVTLGMIGGRWKINILSYLLNNQQLRYGELKNKLTGISERMLNKSLKELENDGLINRITYKEFPPKTVYELTELGNSLDKILILMDQWGEAKINLKE